MSDKFGGKINGDLNGTIATMLDATGQFTYTTIQPGSIAGLTVTGRVAQHILAGGDIRNVKIGSSLASDAGKDGVDLIAAGTATDNVVFSFGSALNFPAGFTPSTAAGSSIVNVFVKHGARSVSAGAGMDSSTGDGGAGGSIVKLTLADAVSPSVILAGNGGQATGSTGNGGVGGDVLNLKVSLGDTLDGVEIVSGVGGNAEAGKGGSGGDLKRLKVTAGDVLGSCDIIASAGGSSATGAAGTGGSLSQVLFTADKFRGYLSILTRDGADGAVGGSSGSIQDLRVAIGEMLNGPDQEGVSIYSGNAAEGSAGNGGSSGSIRNVSVSVRSGAMDGLFVTTGTAGNNQGAAGIGGGSGSLQNISFASGATIASVATKTGWGGGAIGTKAGDSGSIFKLKLNFTGIVQAASLETGVAGSSTGDNGTGGSSGAITDVSLKFSQPVDSGNVRIVTSNAGDATGSAGTGGNVGPIKRLQVAAPGSEVFVNFFDNGGNPLGGRGGSDAASIGGTGGDISGVKIDAKLVHLAAAGGGYSGGIGGAGGSITGFTAPAKNGVVQQIRAGNGGFANVAGGIGGSIVGVTVKGDIGDFTQAFGFDLNQMGGISAGQAGATAGSIDITHNGSVLNVSAGRIAAIISGAAAAGDLSFANAVARIGIRHATAIGADVDGDKTFDFADAGETGYHLGEGDVATDGVVIVLKDKFKAPVSPLKLVEVPLLA